jgi:hypothetical protein
MNVNLTPKPINFKFGEYINKGFELMKKLRRRFCGLFSVFTDVYHPFLWNFSHG